MSHSDADMRPGEVAVTAPPPSDAALLFIGRIRTPWTERHQAPRQGSTDGPECRIEVFEPWLAALEGLQAGQRLEVLYWLHLARRDLVMQCRGGDIPRGTFSLRSPVRPNPIGTAVVDLLAIADGVLRVRGLDCVDGTPLLDLKPERRAAAGPHGGKP